MIESILISISPILAYKLAGGKRKLLSILIFISIMFAVTIAIMYYRCKIATEADKYGKKPDVDIKKSFIGMTPLLIWGFLAFILPYLVKYDFPPIISLVLLFVTGMFGLFIVSFLLYTNAIKYGAVPQCYPSTLDEIFSFLKSLWPF